MRLDCFDHLARKSLVGGFVHRRPGDKSVRSDKSRATIAAVAGFGFFGASACKGVITIVLILLTHETLPSATSFAIRRSICSFAPSSQRTSRSRFAGSF